MIKIGQLRSFQIKLLLDSSHEIRVERAKTRTQ
jgi:hypothetical protein